MYRSVFRSAPRTAAVVVWAMRDQLVEVRSWIDELMPRRRLPGRPRTKRSSSGSAAVTGIQLGDDTAALAARRRLEPLLAVIDDPYPTAGSQLAVGMELAHRRRLRRRAARSVRSEERRV